MSIRGDSPVYKQLGDRGTGQQSYTVDVSGGNWTHNPAIEFIPSGILVGTAGIIKGWLTGDDVATPVRDFPVGVGPYPLSFQKIQASGTTAGTSFTMIRGN